MEAGDVEERSHAEVVFDGSTLVSALGAGQSALAALTEALKNADLELQDCGTLLETNGRTTFRGCRTSRLRAIPSLASRWSSS